MGGRNAAHARVLDLELTLEQGYLGAQPVVVSLEAGSLKGVVSYLSAHVKQGHASQRDRVDERLAKMLGPAFRQRK
jgi:hypothetical protein